MVYQGQLRRPGPVLNRGLIVFLLQGEFSSLVCPEPRVSAYRISNVGRGETGRIVTEELSAQRN